MDKSGEGKKGKGVMQHWDGWMECLEKVACTSGYPLEPADEDIIAVASFICLLLWAEVQPSTLDLSAETSVVQCTSPGRGGNW